MRKTKYTAAGWLIVLIVIISSCKQSVPEQTKYIPKDASVVLSINPKKINDKLADSHVSLDSIIRSSFSGDTSALITGDDIANSGIDVSKDVYLFVNQSGSMMAGNSVTTGIVAAMNKASAFEALVKKKMPSAQIIKDKNYSYTVLQNGFLAGWNDEVALITNVNSYGQDGEQTATPEAAHAQLTALFTQKEEASLASLKQFKDAADGKADMMFWSNSNGALASVPMVSMSKASDLFKDTYTSGTINFENGKVEMDVKTYPNAVLADTLKKYAGPKVDMDLLSKYPGVVNGFALFSFNPKLIVSILEYMGVVQTANQFLQNQGYTLDDITKAFKGDFAVMFSNVHIQQKEEGGQKYNAPIANLIIDAAIGDKASYDKIVMQLAKQGLMVQHNGQYVPAILLATGSPYSLYADQKNLVFASDSVLLHQYMSGSGKSVVPSEISGKVKGSSVAFYADIASLLNAVPADTATSEILTSAKQTFKDVIATTENYGNSVIKGHAELHTVNDKQNSLATLTKYFGSISATLQKMKESAGVEQSSMMDAPDNANQNK